MAKRKGINKPQNKTEQVQQKKKGFGWLFWLVLLIILLLLGGFAYQKFQDSGIAGAISYARNLVGLSESSAPSGEEKNSSEDVTKVTEPTQPTEPTETLATDEPTYEYEEENSSVAQSSDQISDDALDSANSTNSTNSTDSTEEEVAVSIDEPVDEPIDERSHVSNDDEVKMLKEMLQDILVRVELLENAPAESTAPLAAISAFLRFEFIAQSGSSYFDEVNALSSYYEIPDILLAEPHSINSLADLSNDLRNLTEDGILYSNIDEDNDVGEDASIWQKLKAMFGGVVEVRHVDESLDDIEEDRLERALENNQELELFASELETAELEADSALALWREKYRTRQLKIDAIDAMWQTVLESNAQ